MRLVWLNGPAPRAAANSCLTFGTVLRPTTTTSIEERFSHIRVDSQAANAAVRGRRYASVKSQGAYKLKNKKTIPKKLGAKKTGDQYVIPGNIIYKQRGTIWHPGDNTIMGRDHTIHAAVAGYVKYYRDPNRHPDRQYIGVVFNRDDKLPYPPGTPRRRKLNLAAVPRKDEAPTGETMSPSGIPLAVTRHDPIPEPEPKLNTTAKAQPETNESAPPSEQPVALTDGNSVILRLIQEKLQARAKREAKEEAKRLLKERQLKERMATRVLRLQSNYSYRETNWDIGRLVGDAGTLIGTEETGESRKAKFRLRKRKRRVYFKHIKSRREARAARRREHRRRVQAKRERLLLERAEAAAKEQAEKNAAAAAAAGGTTDQGKVEA